MKIKNLNHEQLQEASKKNDAATYHVFEQWLKQATRILEKEDRILLLAFDEFEKLNEADQAEYLNLRLVLDWFRSIIQNFSRVALLFSGVHTFGEMGTDWSGYFVNVQTLKVSFLHPQEARNLITHPTPDFPSEHIFGEGVVEEIIRVTGCHPFFVQGVCSALMDYLNAEEHLRADTQDVQEAVHQFIDSWWDGYFRDLWERTDEQQRACLVALKQVGVGSFPTIIEHSELDEQTLHRVLETLLKRDIIRHHQGQYCMASPIIEEWVQRISYQ